MKGEAAKVNGVEEGRAHDGDEEDVGEVGGEKGRGPQPPPPLPPQDQEEGCPANEKDGKSGGGVMGGPWLGARDSEQVGSQMASQSEQGEIKVVQGDQCKKRAARPGRTHKARRARTARAKATAKEDRVQQALFVA